MANANPTTPATTSAVRFSPRPTVCGARACLSRVRFGLRAGGTEAIPRTLLLIDERLGRSEAQRLGIAYMGTAGVLCVAKELGYLKAVLPVLNELLAAGYFLSDMVVSDARKRSGE